MSQNKKQNIQMRKRIYFNNFFKEGVGAEKELF
jgi:hypothetical protein